MNNSTLLLKIGLPINIHRGSADERGGGLIIQLTEQVVLPERPSLEVSYDTTRLSENFRLVCFLNEESYEEALFKRVQK